MCSSHRLRVSPPSPATSLSYGPLPSCPCLSNRLRRNIVDLRAPETAWDSAFFTSGGPPTSVGFGRFISSAPACALLLSPRRSRGRTSSILPPVLAMSSFACTSKLENAPRPGIPIRKLLRRLGLARRRRCDADHISKSPKSRSNGRFGRVSAGRRECPKHEKARATGELNSLAALALSSTVQVRCYLVSNLLVAVQLWTLVRGGAGSTRTARTE